VVFVREWCAKQRHDPIAHHLVHRALVPMHGLHHQLKDRIQDLPSFLWIAVRQ
jgi:hypothetical protein